MSLETVLAELQSNVNQEVQVGPWLTVTQAMIDDFGRVTGDMQWIHVDPVRAAAESPFGAAIAHGYLTLSLIPQLIGSVDPERPRFPGVKMGVNYGLNKVRFPHPVRAGSKVRARVTLLSVEVVKGDGLQLINRVTVEIEHVEKPACVAETVSRVYF
ncbi:MAG: MaoC family dehydratase [Caldilineaceae bacterium]|nr:MaoC family dehydratase [Caldilineaceae bacterium]MCB9157971.1 MaoC family dehydratase [Caldilineaceae bacterium]